MSSWTGDYKEYASNQDSKYAIGFAEADLNCVKGVRLWPKGSKKKCGYDEVDLTGRVVIEYTDYCYENPRGEIDPGPYNKVSSNPDKYLYPDPLYYVKGDPAPVCPTVSPFSDPTGINHEPKRVYMTGKEYAALGCCKVLEDLPTCLSTEMRVDIFPSVDAIGIPDNQVVRPDCPSPISYNGECRPYEAKVFCGDFPSQNVTWSVEGGTSTLNKISSTTEDITYYKAELCIANDEKAEKVRIQACSTFDNSVCGYSDVRLKPRIIIKVPEGIDGFTPCQVIDIDAWIFGGGNHQELNLTISGHTQSDTRIVRKNDGKWQLVVSCNEPNGATGAQSPIRITATDITGHNFIPPLKPNGNGGSEYFDLPKKWLEVQGVAPNSVTCATCGSPTSPGYSPCGNTTQYRAWMNWGSPCTRRENVTDKVAWTVEGAVNSDTSIWVTGTGTNAVANYRRGGNIYSQTQVVTDATTTCTDITTYICDVCTTQSYITVDGVRYYYTYSYACNCSNRKTGEDCTTTTTKQYVLLEPCEGTNVKIVATSNEQVRGTNPPS
jgi:hypothetical protein